jgi:hypothetical protein
MARGRQDRKARVPFGVQRRKMTLDKATEARLKAEGKVPRWVNDDDHGSRLQQAQDGSYEFLTATGTEAVGDAQETQERDRRIKKLVGTHKDGSPKYAFLMAIDKELYDEDQAAKEQTNKMVDQAIKGGNPSGLGHHGISPDKGGTHVKTVDYTP